MSPEARLVVSQLARLVVSIVSALGAANAAHHGAWVAFVGLAVALFVNLVLTARSIDREDR
jgi:hypothetical protein